MRDSPQFHRVPFRSQPFPLTRYSRNKPGLVREQGTSWLNTPDKATSHCSAPLDGLASISPFVPYLFRVVPGLGLDPMCYMWDTISRVGTADGPDSPLNRPLKESHYG